MSDPVRVVLLDVDGTLVDTNYLHVIAWRRAFRASGIDVPGWVLHRQVGKGGDRFVAAAAGEEVERRCGDAVRDAHGEQYGRLIEEVRPLPGARELVLALRERGVTVALASSGRAEEVERYIDLLGVRDALAGWTTAADVDSSKPAPDLVGAALARAGGALPALLVGDTVWDGEAARAADVGFVAVLTGGISEAELHDAGARAVFASAADLASHLDDVLR
jgi:phosphoglycolate phosphatase-like HAD superfamily hydrolase